MPIDDTFGVGAGGGTPLDDRDYQGPFAFTGKIHKLTIALDEPKLTPEDRKKLGEAYRAVQEAKRAARAKRAIASPGGLSGFPGKVRTPAPCGN
jgi:hypothetical protein